MAVNYSVQSQSEALPWSRGRSPTNWGDDALAERGFPRSVREHGFSNPCGSRGLGGKNTGKKTRAPYIRLLKTTTMQPIDPMAKRKTVPGSGTVTNAYASLARIS